MSRVDCALIRVLTIVFVLLQSSSTLAAPLAPKVLQVEGKAGLWFPRDDADRLLDVLQRKLPALEKTVEAQDKLIALQKIALTTATTALERQEALAQVHLAYSSTITAKALDLARTQVPTETPLLERPWTNFTLGFALGVIIFLAARATLVSSSE